MGHRTKAVFLTVTGRYWMQIKGYYRRLAYREQCQFKWYVTYINRNRLVWREINSIGGLAATSFTSNVHMHNTHFNSALFITFFKILCIYLNIDTWLRLIHVGQVPGKLRRDIWLKLTWWLTPLSLLSQNLNSLIMSGALQYLKRHVPFLNFSAFFCGKLDCYLILSGSLHC